MWEKLRQHRMPNTFVKWECVPIKIRLRTAYVHANVYHLFTTHIIAVAHITNHHFHEPKMKAITLIYIIAYYLFAIGPFHMRRQL